LAKTTKFSRQNLTALARGASVGTFFLQIFSLKMKTTVAQKYREKNKTP
jgi:hypothetical protein